MIEKVKFGSSCLGLLMLSACTVETVDSANIRTGGIVALLRATATSEMATSVTAQLKVGGDGSNTYVDLSNGDSIFAVGNDRRIEMEAQGTGTYQADFDTAAENTEFIVDLQRDNDDDAPMSTGMLPGPFTFVVPNMTTSRGQSLTVTWTPSGSTDDMTMELNGTCIFHRSIDIPGDTGSHVIEPGTLVSVNTDKPETCDVTVDMKRTRNGTADAAFDPDSSFVLEQTRTAKFTSAP